MIEVQQLIEEARTWIGVPFRHQGRSKYGTDCIGLIVCIRNAVEPWAGMYEPSNYSRTSIESLLVDKMNEYGFTPVRKVAPGVVILIKWPKSKTPTHVALCLGETMIHAYRRTEKVCEVGYREPWLRMTSGLYRMPGVRYE